MQETTTRPLATVEWVAQRLGVRLHRVYDLVREDRLPGVVRLGRQIRIDPDRLEEFIASGGDCGEA
jgi:excisionase family DNA binding protein